jgi:RNase H-fold protein (predicted Holliday junction resolvase)
MIGLAFSDDEMRFVAHSFNFESKSLDKLEYYYTKYKPDLSIIGLPSWGQNRNFVQSFAHNNRKLLNPFIFIDEVYSTQLTDLFNPNMQKDQCAAGIFVYFALENPKFLENSIKTIKTS